MAMVRPSPSHPIDDDQVDSDFFDQLANGDLEPLQSDFQKDEGDKLDDAFSKLILGDAPTTADALVSSPTTDKIDIKDSVELAFCPKDVDAEEVPYVAESGNPANEALSTAAHPLLEPVSLADERSAASDLSYDSVNLHRESNDSVESQPLVMEAPSFSVSAGNIAAADVPVEHEGWMGLEPSELAHASLPDPHLITGLRSSETPESNLTSTEDNNSTEAFQRMPLQNGSIDFSDGTAFDAHDHSQSETPEIKSMDTSIDQKSVEELNSQSLLKLSSSGDTGLPGTKELQWSSFGNSCIPDAFGSYSDFFSELGSETVEDPVQQMSTRVGGYQAEALADPSAALSSQGSLGESFSLQAASYYGAPLEPFDERVYWNQQDIPNIGVVEQDKLRSAGSVTVSNELQSDVGSKQSYIRNDIVSELGSVNDMPATNYDAQPQEATQQSWENIYPGWYFDYGSNEWKQIESSSAEQSQHATRDEGDPKFSQPFESNQSATTASDSIFWQSNQGHDVWSNQGFDHNVTTTGTHAASDDKHAAISSQSEHQTNWEQQYPGWYFDYDTQHWCQIQDTSQNWGFVNPELPEASGNVELVKNLQSSGEGWIDQWGQPQHQSEMNQSIYPESGQDFHSNIEGRDMNTLGQAMPLKSWGEPTTDGLGFREQGVANFKWAGDVSSFQGSDRNASYHSSQLMTDSVYQFQQNPNLSDKQSVVGSSHGFFQSHPTSTGSVGPEGSSAGRPSHALVAFGFGGKLVTMKAPQMGYAEPLVIQDLSQLVSHAESQNGVSPYFSVLSRLGLTGPLHGCSSKDVLRWIDERIENCGKEDLQGMASEGIRILWGVLKIACQHYGKLRSVAGSAGIKPQMEEGPEVALGRLLTTMKSHSHWTDGLATSSDVLYSFPVGHQLQAAVNEVRNHLTNGKLRDALQIAQQAQLWGLALVLAWQLGEKVYADTVLQMAQKQFSLGSPMRTLLLLFAGQASELFKVQTLSSSAGSHGPFTSNSSSFQDSAGGMLSDWLGNLSIIAANPTKGDEQVIMHLGDSLWKDQGEVAGAHTCYLVADTTFESFSKEARLCLVGADHFKLQRTFATPQAIQRTEVYEYAKSLGNPQYVLVPFQPFKLLYAHMLAEAGRIAEASRYCQMVTKNLKSAGRGSEIEFCKQSAVALEERLRLHSQGGYSLNFSTGKLVGKFMGTIDSTIHKIIGGPPLPQQAAASFGSSQEWYASDQNVGSASKSTPMMPSASNSNLSSVNNPVDVPARSVSEPNLIRSSTQEPNAEVGSASPSPSRLKSAGTSGGGYLGRFGSQIFAKAVGLMRHSKEAKLGDQNKFYYDEKLKRWVEAGAEQSSEEAVLAPPPIVANFNSSSGSPSDVKSGGESHGPSAGASSFADLPPIPPSVNQFSNRGRLHGVRSRYVDTFNKGNVPVAARTSPSPAVVPAAGGRALTGSPSQFFPSPSFTAAANGSLDKLGSRPNDDGSKDFQTPASDEANNGFMQVENEPLLPKNLNSSFMNMPMSRKHSSTGNMANDHSQGKADSSLGSMGRTVSWSGEAPDVLYRHNLSNGSMTGAQTKTSLNVTSVAPLPSPPILEPPPSYIGYGSGQMQTGTGENMSSESLHGAVFGEMREVEL